MSENEGCGIIAVCGNPDFELDTNLHVCSSACGLIAVQYVHLEAQGGRSAGGKL